MPKVSVIIPVYNVEKYLRACLDSVVNQTLKDIEIICVNDGSTDGSSAIIAEYAAKDPRVKVITCPHTNAGAARNAGMAVATGEYLGFVDSDDWCELTLFEKAYETAEKDAADVVYWRFALCDAASGVRIHEGLFSAEYNRETALISYNLAPWSRLVRRDFVLREKLSFQEIARSNDVYFGGMVMMLAQKASVLDEVLYSYRTGQSSSLQANNANTPCVVIEAWVRLIEEWRSRKIGISGRIVYSAAFASLFYTLESIRDAEAYKLLWQRLKSFGTDLNAEDTVRLSNDRLMGLWADLLAAETPFDYLVRRQKASSNTISVLWHKLHSCEGELKSMRSDRKRILHDLESSLAETAACRRTMETELLKRDKGIAEFESSRLCRWALAAVRRLSRGGKKMTSGEYLFSFVMAVYNVEDYLDEAIESIAQQTIGFDRIQLILVDDGSADNSLWICRRWQAQHPDNIEVIHQENAGVSAARNNGLEHVKGKYVSFMDSDDKIVPSTCERVARFFEQHEEEVDLVAIPMVFFEAVKGPHILNVKFDKGNRVIDLNAEWGYPQLSMSSAFVKAEALENIRFDTRLKHLEDMKVVQGILLRKRAYGVVSTVRYQYRRRAGASKSAVQSATMRKTWYTDTLTYASEALLDAAEGECRGVIPKYVQYAVMYDLQWRLALEDLQPGVLSADEEAEYRDKVVSLLRRIDVDVIMAQRNIYSEHKFYALCLRSRGALTVKEDGRGGFAFYSGKNIVMEASRIPARMEFMWQEGEFLVVDMGLNLPEMIADGMNCLAYLGSQTVEMKVLGEKTTSRSMGVPILRTRYCRFRVPISVVADQGCRLTFFLRWKTFKVELPLAFGRFFPLTEKYLSSYWSSGRCVVSSSSRKWLWIEPKSQGTVIRREWAFLRDLWRKNLLGARKAVVVRTIVHVIKKLGCRPFWLISDRATAARDNGEAFFEYMCREHPEQKVFFAINKSAAAYRELKKKGPVLARNGYAYKLRLLLADWIISSQAEEQVTDPFWGYDASYKDMLANKRYVFLGHGITQNDISGWIGRYKKGITGIVAASDREASAFSGADYGYAPENVWLTGLPRYDRLYHDEKKQILVMPTWRRELMGVPNPTTGVWSLKPDFKDSDYYRFYNGLLNNQRLLAAVRKQGYTIAFFPHPNLQPYVGEFEKAPEVQFINAESEYRDVLARGDVLVTDYSSVAFDFAYLRKPVVYSHFDKEQFYQRTSVLKPGYFDYERDGFGPVVCSLEGIVDELVQLMSHGCKLKRMYRARINSFFAFKDSDNSRRVYEQIVAMQSAEKER